MTLDVTAPLAGTVVAMADVSDPVFAQEIVGPGIAVQPGPDGPVEVVAPVAGRIVKLHPHAFVLLTTQGVGILVHLGIDTVTLHGDGFVLHHQEKDTVAQGEPLVTWDPGVATGRGLDPVVPVVVLEAKGRTLRCVASPGDVVATGDPLLSVE